MSPKLLLNLILSYTPMIEHGWHTEAATDMTADEHMVAELTANQMVVDGDRAADKDEDVYRAANEFEDVCRGQRNMRT